MPINKICAAQCSTCNHTTKADQHIVIRRNYLAELSRKHSGTGPGLRYYLDRLDHIEDGILPLVIVMDTPLTTPIFSCEGHKNRNEPYVMFVVLPGKECEFQRFASNLMRTLPHEFVGMRFEQRLEAIEAGKEPFIDWRVIIDVPTERLRSPKSVASRNRSEILRYARFIRTELRKWQEGRPP